MTSNSFTISCQQLFSRRGLGYLWDKRTELDPGQEAILQSLWNNKKKTSIRCEQSITYRLSNKKAGKLGFGRFYGTKGSLETLERECRGTLCREYYHDIDIVNCHPVLIVQLAKKLFDLDMPSVEEYCNQRDEYLSKISSNKDEAKTAVIKILYHGRNTYDFLEPFQKEIKDFTKRLVKLEKYTQLWDACQAEDNKYGTFLAFVLQTEERDIMLAMKDWFESNKWSVDVLAYDGVMIRKDPSLTIDKETLLTLEKYLLEKTGYSVQITNKEFSYYEVPQADEEITPGVPKSAYVEEKARFELSHFYYSPTNQIAEVEDGLVTLYDLEHAKEKFRTEFVYKKSDKFGDHAPLFDTWRGDLTKRVIKKIDFKPTTDSSTFVLPINYNYLKSEVNSNAQKSIDMFKYLIAVNTNHIAAESEYVLKYMAHLLQKPFDYPRTALLFIGNQGAGKDMIWEFLGSKVLGSLYYADYGQNQQFFAPHDTGRQDKFLVKVQEADPVFFRKNASDLKALITSPSLTFNPKGRKEYTRANYQRLILTTNKGNPLELEQSDRRWVICTNSNELCGNYNKVKEIVAALFEDPGAAAAVADYLLSYPLADFHPETHKPDSEFKKLILESEKSSEEQFVDQWDGAELSTTTFYNLYREYCTEHSLPAATNSKSLGIKLLKMIANGNLKKRKTMTTYVYSK